MNLYPIMFRPIIKTMVWGQEIWEVTCRPQEMGIIENGPYAGMAFDAYLAQSPKETLGTRHADTPAFPLLIKIITAKDALSVQVHPDDAYAEKHAQNPTDTGKSELWYILEPPTGGRLIIGLRDGVTREGLYYAHNTVTMEDCLFPLPVKAGDMVNIPAGLVHALTPGAVIAEVQQNSDTTYRLYDYNRPGLDGKPRALHFDHAANVADFAGRIPKEVSPLPRIAGPHFTVEKHILEAGKKNARPFNTGGEAFSIIIATEGEAVITYNNGELTLPNRRAAFLPAALTGYHVCGGVILHCQINANT